MSKTKTKQTLAGEKLALINYVNLIKRWKDGSAVFKQAGMLKVEKPEIMYICTTWRVIY